MAVTKRRLGMIDEGALSYSHPLYENMLSVPGLSVGVAPIDLLLQWGLRNSLWVFPMATSCCGIELMAAAASRVDLDRMGTIVRGTPRQADVMVIAGTITVKMAPRVLTLWEQMPEPKWAIAMGSCAISGDFYRDLYAVVPGIDTVLPVDVYVPGCPPNPEALMHGLMRLQEKVKLTRAGELRVRDPNPAVMAITRPSNARKLDPARDEKLDEAQRDAALHATSLDESDQRERPAAEPAAAMSKGDGASDLEATLQRELGVGESPKEGAPIIAASEHVALAQRLREAGFRQLVTIVATHFAEKTGAKPAPERFEVTYILRSIGAGSRLASWRLSLATGEGAPTLVGVFAGADWQEREQYDLVGVRFLGHPDLRRILMPADCGDVHPLRKDFAADSASPPWR